MNMLDMISGSILNALGCNMDTFLRYFPAAETMYTIFIALGMGFLLLNFVWQLFKNFGLGMGIEAEDPAKLTMRTVLFMLCTVFSSQIVNIALKIGGTPYQWIVDSDLPPIQFASFLSVITPIIGGIVNGSVLLISLVVIIVLAWNYLKLLFEAAERYILLGVLVFTAPVAISMGGSQSTGNIFKSWCRMLGGQIFLLMMNAWCLKLFTSMFGEFIANPMDDGGNLFIWLLCSVGFLKVSQKIDSFMGGLGISVGRTGGNMLDDAIVAARSLAGARKMGGGGMASGGKAGGSSASSAPGTAPNTGFMSGGLAGMVGRKVSSDTASNLSSEPGSEKGGIFAGLGGKLYNSSVGEVGGFAANVIGSVAKGRGGQINGDKATEAFNAYMGSVPSSPSLNTADTTGGAAGGISSPAGGVKGAGTEIPMGPETGMQPKETESEDIQGGIADMDSPESDFPLSGDEIPMNIDGGEPEVSDTFEDGSQSYGSISENQADVFDSESMEPVQPIPTGADSAYLDFAGADDDTGGMFSGAGPTSYGDNGESAVAALNAEAQMTQMTIPTDMGGSIDAENQSYGDRADFPGMDVSPGTSSESIEYASGGMSSISENMHTSIPGGIDSPTTGTASTEVSGAGSNEIPGSGSDVGGTVVTGADSVTAGGSVIPVGGGTGIGVSPGNGMSGTSLGSSYQSDSYSEGVHSSAFSSNYGGAADTPYSEPPTYRDITMGGGRITGVEVSPQNPNGIQFAMYHVDQYARPDGQFSIVKSLDGAKWYKQYAKPDVERTPIKEENGKVEYQEKIVKKLPKGPPRIDRI